MTPPSRAIIGALALAAAFGALLAGCGGDKPEALIASAKGYIAKHDSRAAIIQLKNALQTEPDSPEARFLLGQALFESGDLVGAEVELRKARSLKQPVDQVDPLLARTLLLQAQYKKVIDEFATSVQTTPQAVASVQTSLTEAYGATAQLPAADAAIQRALAAQPDDPAAGVAAARLQAAHGQVDAALATLAAVIDRAPDAIDSADAYKLRGDMLRYTKHQDAEAMTAYRKAVALQPTLVLGQVAIIELLLQHDDLTAAATQIDILKKLGTGRAQERYLEARLAYQKKEYKSARDLVLGLLKAYPDIPVALQLAALVELDAFSPSQAISYANRAIEVDPTLFVARRTLIEAYLRTGQVDRAMSALLAVSGPGGILPPNMYDVAGQVYLQNRDLKKAEEYFAKASKTKPDDVTAKTSLAVTRIARGDGNPAFDQLQAVAAGDKGVTADLALINAYMARNDLDRALAAVDKLETKRPGGSQAPDLRGRIKFLQNDLPAARASFERAAGIDATFYAPVSALVAIDMSTRQFDAAKKRLDDFTARNPGNVQATTSRAEVAIASGEPKAQVVDRIGKIVSANPSEPAPRLLLVNYLLQNGDVKGASSAADDALAAVPQDPGLLEAQGRAQSASGEYLRAQDTFSKLATLLPASPAPHLRIAETYVAAGNTTAAQASLHRSLGIQPAYLPAQFALVSLAIIDKKFDQAMVVAKTVQKQRPTEAAGFMLEGDVDMAQARFDAAASAYRVSLKTVSSSHLALKLYAALVAAGKTVDADAWVRDWERDHPTDAALTSYAGDLALARRDYAAAETRYRAVVAKRPDNAMVYNNLAWAVSRQGKPGALEFAETANRLGPHQPAILDTLAGLVADAGDFKRALALENEAMSIAPDLLDFKLNRARILVKSGDKAGARADLESLGKLGDKFKNQVEVTALLKQV